MSRTLMDGFGLGFMLALSLAFCKYTKTSQCEMFSKKKSFIASCYWLTAEDFCSKLSSAYHR